MAICASPGALGDVESERLSSQSRVQAVPMRVLWGDLHLHSNLSADAFVLENRVLGPDAAYRFARGETISSTSGKQARLREPLDFLAVTDHAEYLGIFAAITSSSNAYFGSSNLRRVVLQSAIGRRWADYMKQEQFAKARVEFVQNASSDPPEEDRLPRATRSLIWNQIIDTAEAFNDPGTFTTLVGYEWTSMVDGNNLHRVVIFADDKDRTGEVIPFSAMDSRNPADLWRALGAYEELTGGSVIAIPHNSNMSNGKMFPDTDENGLALAEQYIKASNRWEPLMEITQVKGDVETHPLISPNDWFADFETWDAGNILQTEQKTESMLRYEYARSVLAVGMSLDDQFGTNPYQFGFVGSTDSHTALSTADADNFFGKFPNSEPALNRADGLMGGKWINATLSSAGYVGVWAAENSRKEIFAALTRKEVYASTGPRITVRFFGGWKYQPSDISRGDFIENAYATGKPMGATLTESTLGQAPRFLVAATKDPAGANLDRIQIIKVWNDANGQYRELIADVSNSEMSESNRLPGSSRGKSSIAPSGYIEGRASLSGYWEDPHFDPRISASYYARVLEVATPRWTSFDVLRYGGRAPNNVPEFVQQRAYTSPIWYRPDPNGTD